MKIRYRITNRFRFTLFVVLSIIIFTCVANLLLGFGTADSSTVQDYKTVIIGSGDTLWNIAQNYYPDQDTNKAVYMLCKLNDITASDLQPGMTIRIPVYH